MQRLYYSTGADRLNRPFYLLALLFGAMIASVAIAKAGVGMLVLLLFIPALILYFERLFDNPKIGLYSTLIWGFIGIGAKRYMIAYVSAGAKLGLVVDFLLLMTFIAFLFKDFKGTNWDLLKNRMVGIAVVWFAYNVMEIANPEARSFAAWFYAVRGVALYMIFTVPLTMILLIKKKDLDNFIHIWFGLSVLGTIWGLKQLFIGLDGAEQFWLSDPRNESTHMLHGFLRVFSYYTDAGQFGAAQGHTAVAAVVLALGPDSLKKRIIYFIVAGFSIWGLMISGTRGAMAVPVAGFMLYLFVSKNWKMFILGIIAMAGVYCFFRFTMIGQGVYSIGRMREAIRQGSDVPSLRTRHRNQKILKAYLRTRPIGGGVGSAGFWGMRFSPNTLLAQTPTDSWYVRIWAEEGIIGLWLFLGIVFYVVIGGGRTIMNIRDPILRQQLSAIYAGFVGISTASYANAVFGQMPTGIIMYLTMGFIFLGPRFDDELSKKSDEDCKIKK